MRALRRCGRLVLCGMMTLVCDICPVCLLPWLPLLRRLPRRWVVERVPRLSAWLESLPPDGQLSLHRHRLRLRHPRLLPPVRGLQKQVPMLMLMLTLTLYQHVSRLAALSVQRTGVTATGKAMHVAHSKPPALALALARFRTRAQSGSQKHHHC